MSDTDGSSTEDKNVEVKTFSEDQFKGLLADKQAEVKKRQTVEQEFADYKTANPTAPPSGDKKEGLADAEAPMTVAQFKELLAEERKNDSDARFTALERESISEVKQNLTTETQGDGLDFDSVIAEGEANLSEGDKLAIRQSKNPAVEKYRRCIFNTPELTEKAEGVRTSKLLDNLKLKGRVPGGGVVSNAAGDVKDISNMSEADLDKLAAELE